MEHNILADDIERRAFRAAFDIAANMGIDLDGSITLARRLTDEAIRFARERANATATTAAGPAPLREATLESEPSKPLCTE